MGHIFLNLLYIAWCWTCKPLLSFKLAMKTFFFFLRARSAFIFKNTCIIAGFLSVIAADDISAQIVPQELDTLSHSEVERGIYHTEYSVSAVPWRVNVLRVNRRESEAEFRTVKAGRELAGLETPTQMISDLESDKVEVIGGINGDFYGRGGIPVNAQVSDGVLIKRPVDRAVLMFDDRNNPYITTPSFSGFVETPDTNKSIDGVNEARAANQLILYNMYKGNTTRTNGYGSESGLQLMDDWIVNRRMKAVVRNLYPNAGSSTIVPHDMVLSGHGRSAAFVDSLAIGDTLDITLQLEPLTIPIVEAIGGSTQFIKNGIVKSNWEERHPRTAVGFSQDSTDVYFVVVDGRQPHSAGMKLSELGEFMVILGAEHAINLDGGGSSAMVLGNRVLNSPSDGGRQRPVSNGLFIVLDPSEHDKKNNKRTGSTNNNE